MTSDKARLEKIINDLQGLIINNSQQLEAIKGDYSSLKTELEQEERLFGKFQLLFDNDFPFAFQTIMIIISRLSSGRKTFSFVSSKDELFIHHIVDIF